MNILEKIRIGSMDYKVILTDKTILNNAQQCYGHIDFNTHIIEIDKTLQDTQGHEQTFLHELVHGIVKEFKIDFSDNEENIVDKLADGLHQVIRDNPEVFTSSIHMKPNISTDEDIYKIVNCMKKRINEKLQMVKS